MGKHRIQNMEELRLFPVLGVVDAMGGLDWEGSMLGFLQHADAVLCFYLYQPGLVRQEHLQHILQHTYSR